MFLEELDQILARDPTVLGTGNPVPLQPSRVEPLANGARGHLADLGDLTCSEDLHCRLSDISLAKFRSCLATRVRPGRDFKPHACGSAAVGRSFLSAPSRSTIHKQLGRGLTLLASCLGCGSAPSDPRHTPFIGNPGIRKSVKIRKIGKAYSNRPTSNHRLGAQSDHSHSKTLEKPVEEIAATG